MADLRELLRNLAYTNVSTYIASENALIQTFKLDDIIKVLVLSSEQLQGVIANKLTHFGNRPDTYHSDTIFLMGIDVAGAMTAFNPRDGLDSIQIDDHPQLEHHREAVGTEP